MIKKTVTYTNFDGETVTEDVYFNMTKAELLELEVSAEGGSFTDQLQEIVKAKDGKAIIQGFKTIVLLSYGQRKGNNFVKSDLLREEFASSEAYSEVFMELATDAEAGAAFINGIMPRDLSEKVQAAKQTIQLPEVPEEPQPFQHKTQEELTTMTQHELEAYFEQLRKQ